ncbi:DUF3137 domain-containing protein [Pedobacter sp. P351]|uniref:DUF3137 domain-containing protein n=1 Tax=Pedobacter superstes TaxID=3133441 RepID=UPI003096DAC5
MNSSEIMPEFDSKAVLLDLEEQRKNIAKAKLNSYYFMAGAIMIAAAGTLSRSYLMHGIIIAAIMLVTGAVLFYNIKEKESEFSYSFKLKVLLATLRNIDPGLHIDPDNGLSESEFIDSGLFNQEPDRISSEDQIVGKVGKTAFCFSEVHAEYKTTYQTKHGTREQWHDIFKGIIFVADFNKHFQGVTVVRAKDTGTALSAWFAKHIPLLSSSSHQLVQLENPAFCKEFVTYSNDQVEARYILTPSLMERLCELNARSENTISVSFIDSYMYLAFPLGKNYFEPPVFKTLLDPDLLHEDIEVIRFMYEIVEDLDLNTRIWGKH